MSPENPRPAPARLRHLKKPRERRNALVRAGLLTPEDKSVLADCPGVWNAAADRLIENAVGCFPVPLGVAENFVINGRPTPVLMATEERTVIAAASKAAKLCLPEGFRVSAPERGRIAGHACWIGVADPPRTIATLHAHAAELEKVATRGWLEYHCYGRHMTAFRAYQPSPAARPDMLAVEIVIDPGGAMGASAVTRLLELAADRLDRVVGSRRLGAIVTNAPHAHGVTVAEAVWPTAALPNGVADRILELQEWAAHDPLRTVTHVKGIMNAVTAVALATGQDTRAIEAAAHDDWHRHGGPDPLTQYRKLPDGSLAGRLRLALPVGTRGGATAHPVAVSCRDIMGAADRSRLVAVLAAAGLAQNFAALFCLATEGICAARNRLAVR